MRETGTSKKEIIELVKELLEVLEEKYQGNSAEILSRILTIKVDW
jgi:chorismate mutase